MRHDFAKPRNRGQGLTEYLLLLVLIAMISVGTISAYGTTIKTIFGGSVEKIAPLKIK